MLFQYTFPNSVHEDKDNSETNCYHYPNVNLFRKKHEREFETIV